MLAALQDLEMEEEIPGKDLHAKLASHVNHRGKLLMRSYLPKASFIQHSLGADSTGGSKASSGVGNGQDGTSALQGFGSQQEKRPRDAISLLREAEIPLASSFADSINTF